jgi:hypothetical protein
VRQPSVEGVGEIKLRRDSSVVVTVGADPEEVRTVTELWSRKNPQGGEVMARDHCGEA